MQQLSVRPEILLSLLDVPLTVHNAWLALKWSVTSCRTQPANSEIENGEAWKWSYSCWTGTWVAWMGCMQCVWSGLGQNARVEFVLAWCLQKMPCFGQKLVFWCIWVFERLVTRVFCLLQCVELVWNEHQTCFYQIPKLCGLLQVTWFWSKSWSWQCQGLYRPVF